MDRHEAMQRASIGELRQVLAENEHLRTQLSDPLVVWVLDQKQRGRLIVALISPSEAPHGPRYAGYYCEDAPQSIDKPESKPQDAQ